MKSIAADVSELDVFLWKGLLDTWGSSDVASLIDRDRYALVNGNVDVDTSDDSFPNRYMSWELLSKFPFELPGLDRKAVAMKKFMAAEDRCAETNRDAVWQRLDQRLIQDARRLIAKVLGECSVAEILSHCSFGPGATTSLSRSAASQQFKWQLRGHGTDGVLPWFDLFCRQYVGASPLAPQLEVVAGNKVTTVPKNAKTDRVIAIEPDWNMFFQRGVGGVIRQRLQRRLGLLLPNAQSINRELARKGSIDGSVATLDLSNASDTIALGLVEVLLPASWFRVLLQLRSIRGCVDGSSHAYEKISSMGNGFTFELETLIFWAIAKACTAGAVHVYGDDIICDSADAGVVALALECCGFTVNAKKSFLTGPFRESCGGHYWHGQDITPCYIKESLSLETPLGPTIRLANKIYKLATRSYGNGVLDERYKGLWEGVIQFVPKAFRGPAELGDACATAPFDMARPSWDRQLQCWRVKTLGPRTETIHEPHWGAVYSSLWSRSPSEMSTWQQVTDRDRKVIKVPVSGCKWDHSDIWV